MADSQIYYKKSHYKDSINKMVRTIDEIRQLERLLIDIRNKFPTIYYVEHKETCEIELVGSYKSCLEFIQIKKGEMSEAALYISDFSHWESESYMVRRSDIYQGNWDKLIDIWEKQKKQ
jgi:hypothetical protein